MTIKENKSFCILPWVHTHVDTNGARRLCCHDNLENTFSNISLEEFWNGDFLKNIRLKMKAGLDIKACQGCIHNITKEHFSPRDVANDTYYESYKDRVETTKEDGSLEFQPVAFDYRFGNICNLSCITCIPSASSSIEKKYQEANLSTFVKKNTSLEINKNEILRSIDRDELRSLYWAGGEPLLSKYHWAICKYMQDKEYSSKMDSVIYNTNLSIPTDKVKELVSFLQKVPSYKLFLSLDGVNEIGEFLREGLDWKLWQNNIDLLSKSQIVIDITVTLASLLYLKDLAKFTIENNYNVSLRSIALVGPQVLLSPLALPSKLLRKIVWELKSSIFKDYGLNRFSTEYINYLNRIETSPSMRKEFGLLPIIYKDFEKKKLQLLSNSKNSLNKLTYENVLSKEPYVFKWWQSDIGVNVLNSTLTGILGDWNKSYKVVISSLGACNIYLRRNNFSNVKFIGINLSNVEVLNSEFSQCEFLSGKIENVKFINCVFINCLFENVVLKDLCLTNIRFENKVLKSEDFYGNR